MVASSCVIACSSTSDGTMGAAGSSSAGTTNGGSSSGGTSGNTGGNGAKAGAGNGNAGNTGNGTAGNTGNGDNGGTANGTAGDTGNGDNGGTGGGDTSCNADFQTDPMNCGHCGKVCESNECDGGECTPMTVLNPADQTTGAQQATALSQMTTVIGANVYEFQYTQDETIDPDLRYRTLRVSSTPTSPASAGTIVTDTSRQAPAPIVGAVTFDANYIYQCSSGGITRTALNASGANPTAFFAAPTVTTQGGFLCEDIAVTADAVYVAHLDSTNGTATIYSLPIAQAAPGTPPTLVPNIGARHSPLTNLTVIGTNLYWYEKNFAGDQAPQLMTSPTTGGTPQLIDSGLGTASGLGLYTDGTYLYYTYNFGQVGELRRAPLSTLTPDTNPVASAVDKFGGIIVNDGYIYFMESVTGGIYRAKADGSTDKESLGESNMGNDIGYAITGVDDNYVYFVNLSGIISRLSKTP